MTFASVAMIRRRRGPANEAARYRTMWEGKTETGGHFTAVVQAQALEGTGPGAGWVRARNLNTGAITSDVEVFTADGKGQELTLPELAVSAGDLVEIQARPQIDTYQIYVEHAAGTVSSVALTIAVPAGVPASFGVLTLTPSPPNVGDSFEVGATIAAGTCDLGGVMNVELEWKTPDGANPMGGTAVGGGWYRGLGKTVAATPASLTWDDIELVAAVAGEHRVRWVATNSTGATVSAEMTFTVPTAAAAVRGFVTSAPATTHTIASSSVTVDGAAVSGTNPSVLQPGDKAFLIITGPGPSDVASLTVSHPGSIIPGGTLAGSGFNPRGWLALVDYTGPTTWTITASSAVRVAAVALAGTEYVAAGTPSYGLSPQDPAGITNLANSRGLFLQLLNFDGGTGTTVTAAPSGHTTVLNSGTGVRQIYVAQVATASAGTYNPGAATTAATTPPGAGSEESTAVAITVSPTVPTGGSGSTSAPTVPTFNSGTAVTLNPTDNCAAIVATYPEGTHFSLAAGTFTNFNDVRPKTGMHFKGQGTSTILEGTGKNYCFRSGTLGASDNVIIGNMLIRNYGNGTSFQEYGAIQGFPNDRIGGSWPSARSNGWFIYGCTIHNNASNGIALTDNCTVYNCSIYAHTVTGINGDRNSGGHLIHTCDLRANALNPATGSSSNGANIKITWSGSAAPAPGRTDVVPPAWQRTPAPIVNAHSTSRGTQSGISGTCRIGFWFDLDVRDVLVDTCDLADHPGGGIFFESCNYGRVQDCTLDNCDGFGAALGENFINGALACGESTNIVFDGNTISNSTNALVNRMSNRTSDHLSSTSSENYAMPPRNWLLQSTTIPANSPAGQSNVWTGNNTFSNNVLVNCSKVIINEGANGGGQTVVGSTNLASIHFTGNDYSGSPGIQFYEVNNTPKNLAQWQAIVGRDRDQ